MCKENKFLVDSLIENGETWYFIRDADFDCADDNMIAGMVGLGNDVDKYTEKGIKEFNGFIDEFDSGELFFKTKDDVYKFCNWCEKEYVKRYDIEIIENRETLIEEKKKVWVVGYYDSYDAYDILTIKSSEEKAKEFIEKAKKPFYVEGSIVRHDFSDLDLDYAEWDLDEYENIRFE